MTRFPTEQWFEQYGRRLDESDTLDEVATGWGVGFDGSIRFVIEGVPLDGTTLGDLPDEVLADLPESVRESVADVTLAETPTAFDDPIRAALPEGVDDLIRQLESHVVDGAINAQLDLREGTVAEVEILDAPDERSVGTVIRGPLATWEQVTDGRPTLSALLTGDLSIDGDELRVLQYSTMLQYLGDVAAAVETTHLFDEPEPQGANDVVDLAAGSSAAIQRSVERQTRRTLEDLSLL